MNYIFGSPRNDGKRLETWPKTAAEFVRTLAYDAGRVIAAAAAESGKRRPIGWIEDLFWLGVVDELAARGVSQRVAADMLGVSRRTYQRRAEAGRAHAFTTGRSLWGALHERVAESPCTRDELVARYPSLSPRFVGSIISDMLDTGWLLDNDGTLHAAPRDREWSNADVAALIKTELGMMGEVDVEAVSTESGFSVEHVEQIVEELTRRGELEPHAQTSELAKWNLLMGMAIHVLGYLRLRAGGEPTGSAGIWGIATHSSVDEVERMKANVDDWIRTSRELFESRGVKTGEPDEPVHAWSIVRSVVTLAPLSRRVSHGESE